jgi:hypothetical protein
MPYPTILSRIVRRLNLLRQNIRSRFSIQQDT